MKKIFHKHRYQTLFAKDKGRIWFQECKSCGHRRTCSTIDARPIQTPLGWPKPVKVRSKTKPGMTASWGS